MTTAQVVVTVVLGFVAWFGLAACVGIAIGLTIRDADRREVAQVEAAEPPADATEVVQLPDRRGTRLDVRL